MSTTTGKILNLVKPALTDDHKITIGTDLPSNFQKIDDEFSTHLAENAQKHITESGSNNNGHYIKFDDGTQICRMTLGEFGEFEQKLDSAIWTFPAQFVGTQSYNDIQITTGFSAAPVSYGQTVTISILREHNINSATVNIGIVSGGTRPNYLSVWLIAIGRWK